MIISNIINDKKTNSFNLKKEFNFKSLSKPIGYIHLQEQNVLDDILEGLSFLPANFIINFKTDLKSIYPNIAFTNKLTKSIGLDFIVCDECESNMSIFFKNGVVPIVSKSHNISSLLKEFNPIQSEGNAYIFQNINKWDIYYALIRYLENFKFPYDNKTLVKNVLEI